MSAKTEWDIEPKAETSRAIWYRVGTDVTVTVGGGKATCLTCRVTDSCKHSWAVTAYLRDVRMAA